MCYITLSPIHTCYNGILDPFDKPYLLTLLKRSCNVDEPCIKTQQKEKKIKKSQKNILDFYNRKKKLKKKQNSHFLTTSLFPGLETGRFEVIISSVHSVGNGP